MEVHNLKVRINLKKKIYGLSFWALRTSHPKSAISGDLAIYPLLKSVIFNYFPVFQTIW